MRLMILNIAISASLLAGTDAAFAANAQKHTKNSKLNHFSKVKAPHDLWERIRGGMQIPLPESTLSTLPQEGLTRLDVQAPASSDCSSPGAIRYQNRKSAGAKRKNTLLQEASSTARVHVRLDVKTQAHKLYLTQITENLSSEDAMELGDEPTNQNENVTEEAKILSNKPCSTLSNTHLVYTTPSESDPALSEATGPGYERVQEYVKRYQQYAGFLTQVTERARPYLYHIVERLHQSKMPMELALLPIVESAYQPKAQSPKSAAGLWQFIPTTGQDFNLDQNELYDARLDVVASTDAAIRYLSFLKQHYNGDWLLALAAYNCGLNTVDEAINRNISSGKPGNYWSLELPEETQAYVPRLLALAKIFSTPEQFSVKLAKIPNQPYFAKVNLNHETEQKFLIDKDFSSIAQLADLSTEEFNRLNPGFLSKTLLPKQPLNFLLPVANSKRFSTHLHLLAKIAPETRQRTLPTSYVATSLKTKTPDHLRSPYLSLTMYDDKPQTSVLRQNPLNQLPLQVNERVTDSNHQEIIIHAVKKGETLQMLVNRYQVSETAILGANGLSAKQILRYGQQLKIPIKKVNVAWLN